VSIHSPDAQVEGAGAERDVRNIAVCVNNLPAIITQMQRGRSPQLWVLMP